MPIIIIRIVYLLAGIFLLVTIPNELWFYPLIGYIFIALCNGFIAHRYFVHGQFEVNTFGRCLLGFLATIGMYSPINYWIVQHKHHHRSTDKSSDIHSPIHGFLHSAFLWTFKQKTLGSIFAERSALVLLHKANKDKIINFFSKNFVTINLLWLITLLVIDYRIALYLYLVGYFLNYTLIGLLNSICHINSFPGNYRNHSIEDNSNNNIVLGIVTLGFGWHNNHHADASKLILTEKWWEIDLEGYCGLLLSKIFPVSKH